MSFTYVHLHTNPHPITPNTLTASRYIQLLLTQLFSWLIGSPTHSLCFNQT